jgi:hypothetical protein
MIIVPGFIIALLTFPGVIVHEAAHQFMCRLTGTPVLKVCYFRVGNPSGYVLHAHPTSAWKHFLICVAPFLFNTVLALLITLPTALAAIGKTGFQPQDILLGWLGISIGMHAIPSSGDAKSLWEAMKKPGTPALLKAVGVPVTGIIMLASLLSFFWFDAIYAAAVCFGIPALMLEQWA